jgi:hypothetical protein
MIPLTSEALGQKSWVEQVKEYTSFTLNYQDWPTRLYTTHYSAAGQRKYGHQSYEITTRAAQALRDHIAIVPQKPGFGNIPSLLHREFVGWRLLEQAQRSLRAVMAGDFKTLGDAMDKTWALERSLVDPSVSLTETDLFYAASRCAGAWGGRPCDGWFVLICPPDKHERLRLSYKEYLNDHR